MKDGWASQITSLTVDSQPSKEIYYKIINLF